MEKKYFNFYDLSDDEVIYRFCNMIKEELRHLKKKKLEYSPLRHKYENMLLDQSGEILKVGLMGYSKRLIPLVKELRRLIYKKNQIKILDAGCGLGSESLLTALLGAKVTGVDLFSSKIRFARSRIPFYNLHTIKPLKIDFIDADILNFFKTQRKFDIIWLIESISHIHPVEDFLHQAYKHLFDNGKIIISDSNALNPISWYRSCRMRGSVKWYSHRKYRDPQSGKFTGFAEERIFPIPVIKSKISRAGFEIENIEMSGFMGSYFLPNKALTHQKLADVLVSFQNIMERLPVIRFLGSNYTIISSKK